MDGEGLEAPGPSVGDLPVASASSRPASASSEKRRLEEIERAAAKFSKTIVKLREEGYSMSDVARELGKSRQGVYELLRGPGAPSPARKGSALGS